MAYATAVRAAQAAVRQGRVLLGSKLFLHAARRAPNERLCYLCVELSYDCG